jgi:hypothetical protein
VDKVPGFFKPNFNLRELFFTASETEFLLALKQVAQPLKVLSETISGGTEENSTGR